MGYIKEIKIGSGTANLIEPILYGTTNTAAGTQAKVVSISNFELVTGVTVSVKFTVTNTHETPQLNVNSTGAKLIKYRGENLPSAATLTANRVYQFVYDGTNWELIGDLDTNTQTITGVKGNSESNYRTGQVNLTAANIGAVAKTGDTMTGLLTLYREGSSEDDLPAGIKFSVKDTDANTSYSESYIYAYHASNTGSNLVIKPGGNLILGSGESASNFYTKVGKDSISEHTYILADTNMYIESNANTISNRAGFALLNNHTIVPIQSENVTDNIGSIGTATYKWANIYATNFTGNLTGNVTGNVSGSAGSVALSGVTDADDLKAIEALSGTSGILKKTAANTWTLDTTAYTTNTGTVTSVAASGSGGISISGSPITTSGTIAIGLNLSTAINGLSEGGSPAQLDDYLVAQFAGGGTTTTTYHRKKVSTIVNGTVVKAALGTDSTHNNQFLRKDGTWQTPADTDTKNTAGSTNSTSKLYLIGATTQDTNPITNSYQYTYTDNGLLSALELGLNSNGTEKAHLEWNDTDQSIDFIFA